MSSESSIRVLVAEDDAAVARIYQRGLPRYFDSRSSSEMDNLENELFGAARSTQPSASIDVCSQGADAVDLARAAISDGTPFDVAILDIRMPPGMDGVMTGAELRQMDPAMPIIFVSGQSDYTFDDLAARVPPEALIQLVMKPVNMSDLAELIQQVCDRPQPSSD